MKLKDRTKYLNFLFTVFRINNVADIAIAISSHIAREPAKKQATKHTKSHI